MSDHKPTDLRRRFALEVVRKLRAAGHEAYWAGGCVRDELLGLQPKDYDVATSAPPERVRHVFGCRRTITIGAAFGVITVLGTGAAGQIDVATFREDEEYRDGRHPERVVYSTAERDAQRRDFTINGMFYDPERHEVIDFVGGRDDLRRELVRAIGDPRERFREDKLRMLRAVRFSATFAFTLEATTGQAIREMATEIVVVSAERIAAEFRRMFESPNRATALRLLDETSLLNVLLPEVALLARSDGDRSGWESTLGVLERLGAASFPLALAALLHRVGGPSLAAGLGRRWRLANKETDRTAWLLDRLPAVAEASRSPWPAVQRLLVSEGIKQLLALREAISGADDPQLRFCHEKLALPADQLNPSPLIGGDDLIARGIPPGRQIGRLLDQIRDAQLLGRVTSRDDAMAMADRLLDSEAEPP
ncbi:MAG: CCA tRNA nucleotidyltransferase [Pirellulales bacterium]